MRFQVINNSLPDHAVAADWESYLSSHPRGNIFQSCGFYRLWLNTPDHEPLAVIAYDDNEKVCGIMQGVIISEPGIFMRPLSARAIAWGAPLANDDAIALKLLAEYERTLGRRVIYSQIRPVGDNALPGVFSGYGFKIVPHLDIINDLRGGEEVMMSLIHKERRRNIGRAASKGVTVRLTDSEQEIGEAVILILNLYRRIGLPAPHEQLLTRGKQFLGGALKIFIAEVGGKIAGARMVLCYRDMVYDWYAGSDTEFRNKYVNDILPWEVMVWASRNGFHIFDFGGAGSPDEKYGVRDFKMRYGGRLIDSTRLMSIHKPLLMFAGEQGLKVYRLLNRGHV